MRRTTMLILTALVLLIGQPARADARLLLSTPVKGAVLRTFATGPHPWSPGHRGVDLAAARGEAVRAAADGVVHFAGTVAGTASVSVDHGGGLRTTYTPVSAAVSEGDRVSAGDVIGHVLPGHCSNVCLHWGLTDGHRYFDPLAQLVTRRVELVRFGAQPSAPPVLSVGVGSLPVAGAVSSHFGMRTHPVTGVHKLHDGVDLAAACGTPVTVPWAGRVTRVERHPAYGNRLIVEHDGRRSAYAHLQGFDVHTGQELVAGARVGTIGSTGLSTGCHLHWMVWVAGELTDPLELVG